ncbi:aldehyde dehydrogenase [Phanerochaete sordida]|uniref:Aldehyde dehydrogenase n=1 Tax=Phanerochaete sordida TaxID=48140 RepID=A0A9P3LL90_9APHY|nr:aldehyde dehydrogenase [Phanerochaete sordida]
MMTTEAPYTSLVEVPGIHARIIEYFSSGTTRPLSYRRRQLIQLARLVQENLVVIEDALLTDLGKQRQESTFTETGPIIQACITALNHLEEWAKPEKPQVEAWRASWDTTVYPVPKGVVLFISPWNYPIIVSLLPMVGCIAAGCPAVLKPSEHSPATSNLMARLFSEYLDPQAYVVVQGAIAQATALLDLPWGHIFFTGGGGAARHVAAAAAKFVTPLTLELGGKNPVIIDVDCDIKVAAKRTLFGKVQNCGQACVSPDYVLVPRVIAPAFYEALKEAYQLFFPTDPLLPESSWGKIINENHYHRIVKLIQGTNGNVIIGGMSDSTRLRIAPTVVADIRSDDILMEEEIFGPVLSIVEVVDVDEAIRIVNDRPHPLVLYAFTSNEETKDKVLNNTNSGTLALNDTFTQLAVYEMPFGGHGASGYGAYFRKDSFDTFTHRRSFINVPPAEEPNLGYRYQPYTEGSYKAMCSGAFDIKIPDV